MSTWDAQTAELELKRGATVLCLEDTMKRDEFETLIRGLLAGIYREHTIMLAWDVVATEARYWRTACIGLSFFAVMAVLAFRAQYDETRAALVAAEERAQAAERTLPACENAKNTFWEAAVRCLRETPYCHGEAP